MQGWLRFFNAPRVFGVLTLIGMGWVTYLASTPQVVTFDQPKLMARFVGQLSAHTLTDDLLREKTDRFSRALNTRLNAYAQTHHVLVLSASQVLAGEHDITPEIEQAIARDMRGAS